ncbi:D-alanyl-D-alanine carboxypeptidase/D-alanyl-D-alanine endopeptidase [Terriglobus tenax]|uniref:D-alanyl-D-alanine carboxypeptidase/D-alanyl-D-alanine endopeptidase n=1 Tax=Terriglobus tenax TaxID=1111115 RepID=UPI0021E0A51F|nr:D-alanyl-D-alanine carboxypeptidase/D-alanyl-D-alanine-endopeptidase [Terriglobus tenax]
MAMPTFAASKKPRKPSLPQQVATILADPSVSRAHWGVFVSTMDGKPVYGLNDAQYFVPASNNKVFTTATAIALLGSQATFITRIVAEGNGTAILSGNLALVGGGDPNLSGRSFPYLPPSQRPKPAPPAADPLQSLAKMADQVAGTGLKTINGDIVGDDTLFPWEPYPEDWAIDDTVGDDGSPVSALTLNDNRIDVILTPTETGKPAAYTFAPAVPYYTIENHVLTVAAGGTTRIVADRDLGARTVTLSGTIALDARPYDEPLAVHDPAEFAAVALKQLLEQRGILVTGKAVARHRLPVSPAPKNFLAASHAPLVLGSPKPEPQPAGRVLATHTSVPLIDAMLWTNKISQNLHAELFLHHLGAAFGDDGSTVEGARVVRSFLTTRASVGPDDFVLFDGSGLSGHDLITPRALGKLLQYAGTQPWFAEWKKTLPIGGEDGTLSSRFPNAPMKDHLFAKTGTLSEARALSGYVDTASGKTLIFSVMVSTHYPRTNADRDAMDKIVTAIAAEN